MALPGICLIERVFAAELFQGPVLHTCLKVRDGFDLGFETAGCATGRARAFGVCTDAHAGATQPHVGCRRALVTRGLDGDVDEKHVLLREKALEMNPKSLKLGDLKSTGCSEGPWVAACSPCDSSRSSDCCMSV